MGKGAKGKGGGKEDFPWTAPNDPRYPHQIQNYYCFTSFCDYHRCTRLLGDGYAPCDYFKKVYTSVCPHMWVDKWNEQLEAGNFPGDLPEKPEGPSKKKK